MKMQEIKELLVGLKKAFDDSVYMNDEEIQKLGTSPSKLLEQSLLAFSAHYALKNKIIRMDCFNYLYDLEPKLTNTNSLKHLGVYSDSPDIIFSADLKKIPAILDQAIKADHIILIDMVMDAIRTQEKDAELYFDIEKTFTYITIIAYQSMSYALFDNTGIDANEHISTLKKYAKEKLYEVYVNVIDNSQLSIRISNMNLLN